MKGRQDNINNRIMMQRLVYNNLNTKHYGKKSIYY